MKNLSQSKKTLIAALLALTVPVWILPFLLGAALFGLARGIFYLIYEEVFGEPHPSEHEATYDYYC